MNINPEKTIKKLHDQLASVSEAYVVYDKIVWPTRNVIYWRLGIQLEIEYNTGG